MRKKTLFLHIGTEKTGTKSLQLFLSLNKKALAKANYFFPADKGMNHFYLASFAAENFDKVKDLLVFQKIKTEMLQADFRNEIEDYLSRLVRKRKLHSSKFVFSNEHCSSRLRTKPEITRLKNLLDRIGFETKVVVYLRRQDDYLISLYNTYIKAGGTEKLLTYIKNKDKSPRFNHYKKLKLWAGVFGKENIIVRIFGKETFINENIHHDFLHAIGIDDFKGFFSPTELNRSLNAGALEFLRNLNFHFPRFVDNKINTERLKIIKLLQELPSGEKIPNNIVSLKAFYDSFAESNTKVANEFLGKPILFREREIQSLLPDEMLEKQYGVHQFFQIFSELWKLNARE